MQQQTEAISKQLPLPNMKYGLTTYLSLENFSLPSAPMSFTPFTTKGPKEIIMQDVKEFWRSPRGKAIYQIFKKQPENQIEDIQQQALHQGKAIIIPANQTWTEPLLLEKQCTATIDADTMIIVAEKNSKASIIETSASTQGCYLRAQRLHIILEENAELSFCSIQNLSKKTYNFTGKTASTGRNAKIAWIDGCFGSCFTSSAISTVLIGEASSMTADTMFFAQREQQFDLAVEARHVAPHTVSDMRTKGVGKDKSKTVYRGNIKIHEHARKSVGYQKEDTLILSDDATVDAIPKLEIDNSDVQCKHGATIGKINQEKMFYLSSRGLSEAEAKKMIIEGFFAPIIAKIQTPELQQAIQQEIEQKTETLLTAEK